MSEEKNDASTMDSGALLKEKILKDHPRLGPDDTFTFSCQPGISCFNHCCVDVNVFLSPYDVLRLKKRLGMSSEEFLDKYAIMPIQRDMKTPVVMVKMNEDEGKACPFLTEKGCGVYSDRPWPCRMYPLGLASPGQAGGEEQFYFLLKEDVCQGHETGQQWTVSGWITAQEIEEYNEIGELYSEITLHPKIAEGKALEPRQLNMLWTACYDLDKFRRFLFETSFFEKFDVDAETIERLKTDDLELLKFGFKWIKFFVLQEQTMAVKDEVHQAAKEMLS